MVCCFIESGGNVALSQPTAQSSTWQNRQSERAVDGNVDPVFTHGSCSHTWTPGSTSIGTTDPWWPVQLPTVYCPIEVHITNREHSHGCKSSLNHHFQLKLVIAAQMNCPGLF